ncbi:hypothetical protein F0562_008743 [Nyssa sinensis]|uniref:glycerophosphodiester phosphodiesterase n=1 Tax=Nyssa sinensis TaxID=561372 RepID=A0A5J5AAH6_9ASTE|nr:hypothetical protein F0562_008743 [Nyssa sinensis]
MIQSTNSSVLMKFKEKSNYQLVYHVHESIRDALNSTILDIKKFANSIVIGKSSVFTDNQAFLTDAYVEINSYVMAGIDGIITDFPATAVKYRSNRCLGLGDKTPAYMMPVEPGGLMQIISPQYLPPAEAPDPVLTDADVFEPPLPSARAIAPTSYTSNGSTPTAAAPTPPNGQHNVVACIFLSNMAILLSTLMLF